MGVGDRQNRAAANASITSLPDSNRSSRGAKVRAMTGAF